MHTEPSHSLLPVLLVGTNYKLAAELEQHGLGVIVADRVERAVRLLKNFTVAAVIYDLPALQRVGDFTALGIPVVLLGAGDSVWPHAGVTVVSRNATAALIAGLIQRLPQRLAQGVTVSHAAP